MTIKFQYNKVSLQEVQRRLKSRQDTLPVLKFKETILRIETEKANRKAAELEDQIRITLKNYEYMDILWQEFPLNAIAVTKVETNALNIAGVRVLQFKNVNLASKNLCLFNQPFWLIDGIVLLKGLIPIFIEKALVLRNAALLELARKKTTQKVNLYEKVQIPGYIEAISKIKKYLSDEEGLGKAVQKIMKKNALSD